jgi:hypothetical protein
VLTTNVFDTRKRQKEAEIASQFIYDLSGDFSVAFSQKKALPKSIGKMGANSKLKGF